METCPIKILYWNTKAVLTAANENALAIKPEKIFAIPPTTTVINA